MSFDNNDPSFYTGMHHPATTLTHTHPTMHGSMFQQNSMGFAWSPSGMEMHSGVAPSSLPSPPSAGIDKPNSSSTTNDSNYTDGKPAINSSSSSSTADACTNAVPSSAAAPLDLSKPYHSEWGVMKEQDFHPLTLKHQRDLENIYNTGNVISDFYFWQANLGGYCMADMIQNIVVSSEGAFPLVRRLVGGAPHPGRRKKKRTPA